MSRGHTLVHSDLFGVERSVCWFGMSDVEHSRDKEDWLESKGLGGKGDTRQRSVTGCIDRNGTKNTVKRLTTIFQSIHDLICQQEKSAFVV